jgi:two-component system, NarL family, invasion response regulator UvrY
VLVSDHPVRVLLVDDQESFREAARLVIGMSDGFVLVGEAETGEEATEMAAAIAPDLVLMDINLPGIDGLEATRRIVTAEDGVRVIVISTYDAAEYESRALEAGAVAFLAKSDFVPGTLDRVWSRVEEA